MQSNIINSIRKTGILVAIASLFVLQLSNLASPGTAKAQISVTTSDFDNSNSQNNLISDANFTDSDSMGVDSIQGFLAGKSSYLASFSEGGRTAAQIIYDAAHGHGDAAGVFNGITISTSTGTVSPKVLLVTLNKEQSLIGSSTDNITAKLNAAMGYSCPDSGGCNPSFAGFTKQVENAAWQLRYNFEAARLGAAWWNQYYAGQEQYFPGLTKTFVDLSSQEQNTVTIGNAATASLYRYTPHVYNGNYNFWKYFNSWFDYSYSFVSESGYPVIYRGEATKLELTVQNTGKVIWDQSTVHLGTAGPLDRVSKFIRESGDTHPAPSGWATLNRINMKQSTVAPGETATFDFYLQAPTDMAFGTYHENFRLVADGLGWLEDYGIYWDVRVISTADAYSQAYVSQSGNPTIMPGQAARFDLTLKNNSKATWTKDVVHLGTDRATDRTSRFNRESGDTHPYPSGWATINRVNMNEDSVVSGQNASFTFYMQAPANMAPGTYREYFRPVVDGIKWLEDYGIYWDVKVTSTADSYSYSFVSESAYPTISRGQAGQFVLTVKNTGPATWAQDVVHLGTDRGRDRVSAFIRESGAGSPHPSGWTTANRIKMDQASVAPGENATFTFYMQAPDTMAPGTYNEYFRLVADGVKWMEDYGIYWGVTVQ